MRPGRLWAVHFVDDSLGAADCGVEHRAHLVHLRLAKQLKSFFAFLPVGEFEPKCDQRIEQLVQARRARAWQRLFPHNKARLCAPGSGNASAIEHSRALTIAPRGAGWLPQIIREFPYAKLSGCQKRKPAP
jgi:hypothetical protein